MVKLRLPSTSMKIRKPLGLSELFGVSTAEKIVGSGSRALSAAMPANIGLQIPEAKQVLRSGAGKNGTFRSARVILSGARTLRSSSRIASARLATKAIAVRVRLRHVYRGAAEHRISAGA